MRPPRYWLRRAVLWLAHYDHRACHLHGCPEVTVGISVWCRRHTDMIVGEVEMDAEMEAAVDAMRARHAREAL